VSEVLITIGISIAAFASTNLDNLFLLMGLVGGARLRTRDIAIGYALSIGLVLAVALAGSYAADWAPDAWLRYLGFIPLAMGGRRIWNVVRGAGAQEISAAAPASDTAPSDAAPGSAGILSVFGVMLANSGDSLGVFASLMGETSELLVLVIFATALGMACLWALAASWVVDHPRLAPLLHKVDRYAVPALLIAIGCYILADTPTDTI
jgi:cadmium resistance protein CadD (predicted permease)